MAHLMFDRTFVLTLKRRADRLGVFFDRYHKLPDWPFDPPQVRYGTDGSKLAMPGWVGNNTQPGSWGCTLSYAHIIEDALSQGWDSVMMFEDDSCFKTLHQVEGTEDWVPFDFAAGVRAFMDAVPDDWDAVYFGGNLRWPRQDGPQAVNDLVMRPKYMTATHGFAMRRRFMERAYERMFSLPFNICDVQFATCMNQRPIVPRHPQWESMWPEPDINVYAAIDRLIGQGPNLSDISNIEAYEKDHPLGEQYWPNPTTITYRPDFLHPPTAPCKWLPEVETSVLA